MKKNVNIKFSAYNLSPEAEEETKGGKEGGHGQQWTLAPVDQEQALTSLPSCSPEKQVAFSLIYTRETESHVMLPPC